MLEFNQADFSGGMNLYARDTHLSANQYALAFNIRNRTAALECVKKPLEDESAPAGLKQGIYAFDKYLLLFNNGQAYYKNVITNSAWTKIANFAMSTVADYLYAEAVPTSRNNYNRVLLEDADGEVRADGSFTETNVRLEPILINGTPAGLVVQDGETQPYHIDATGVARKTQTYAQWTKTNREYVPVMTKMKFYDGILFGIAKDGRTLYRSVSGRPIDFVVNITRDGDKGGDASTTSYSVGYEPITCISTLNSGELFIASVKTCHPVSLSFEKTLFAEPTFKNNSSFSAGVVNQFSFIDKLSDYCFIDTDGVRSFNAVLNQNNEGRNSNFSKLLSSALIGIKQSVCCAIVFDNYSIFSLTTIYGPMLAIFDNDREQWVCFDSLGAGIGAVKQFAIADQSENPTLYAITADKVYRLFSSEEYLPASVRFRAFTTGTAKAELRLQYARAVFDGGTIETIATATEFTNNTTKTALRETIGDNTVDNILFNFGMQSATGWKTQVQISWANDAKLALFECEANDNTGINNIRTQASRYPNT